MQVDSVAEEPLSVSSRVLSRRTVISMVVAVAIVAIGVWRSGIDWGSAGRNIRNANPELYLLAALAFYCSFVVRALRWQLLLRNAGEVRRTRPLLGIILSAGFVNCVVPAKLGDLYRAFQARQRVNLSATKAFGTIVAERLVDLVVLMALLIIAGGLSFGRRVPHELVPYLIAGLLLCVLGAGFVLALGKGRGQRILVRLPERLVERYEHFRVGTVHAVGGRWVEVTALSVLVWLLEGTRLGLVVLALGDGARLGPAQCLLVALIGALLTTVPFTPGGLGVVEGGLVVVLTRVENVPAAQALSIALLDRSLTYVSLVMVGFAVFTALNIDSGRRRRTLPVR